MKKFISSFIGVAIIATLFVSMVTSPHVLASDCKDVSVLFARGSSQNLPSDQTPFGPLIDWTKKSDGKIVFDRDKQFRDTEKESAKYFEGIGNRVLAEYPTLTMQFVSLHDFAGKYNADGYRAVPAFGSIDSAFLSRNAVDARFGYSSIVGESTYGDYRRSVEDGAEELAGYLADEMVRCPNQYMVVGGFSQGAQVVGDAMAMMHTRGQDNLLSRLGHVDMFGDPKFNGFKLDTNRLNPLQEHSILPWVRGSANINEVGSLGPRDPYVPDILTSQTTSWCDFNDVVCGGYAGFSVNDAKAHGHVYSDTGGWIEKSSNETYIAMKHRLSLLAGVADKSANSPIAYWPGIEKPTKLDVMFVMDSTADESLSLVPDPDYLSNNFAYLANPIGPDGTQHDYYSSIHAGVETYTEFQEGNDVISYPKNPVYLTEDIYSQNGAFASGWAQSHFLGNYYGGVDLQDSPFSAINKALDQGWRSDSRKVIVLFSNTWGKDTEPGTNLTMKKITAKARSKHVEILPVFTSKTFRANSGRVQYITEANAFYSTMAKQSSGHATEVTDSLSSTLVYDVIMGHVFAPNVSISLGKTYVDSKTKKPTSTDLKDKKTVVKKGKKVVLSASKSSSPKSKVTHYAWDLNGDGKTDYESDNAYIEPMMDTLGDNTICVTVTDAVSKSSTDCEDITVTDDDSQVTDSDPLVLNTPAFDTKRSGDNLMIFWPSITGTIVFKDAEGAIIAMADGSGGTFTLQDVPAAAFNINLQLVDGIDQSESVTMHIDAAAEVPAPASIGEDSPQANDSSGTVPIGDTNPTPGDDGASAAAQEQENVPADEAVSIESDVLGATTSSATLLAGQADVPNIPLIAGTQSGKRVTLPKAGQKEGFGGKVKRFLSAASTNLSEVVQDFLAWLILIVLLLVWLYLKNRRRDERTFQYDQQKRYA